MQPDQDKIQQLSSEVRSAAKRLNEAMAAAAKAGIIVDLDTFEASTMGVPTREKRVTVQLLVEV